MDGTRGGIHLPHDVILDILSRLPLRALANSRRVCSAWRDAIDDSTLLLTHFPRLFPPRAFPGFFTSNEECNSGSYFFAPAPSSSKARCDIDTDDHCFRYPLFDHHWASVKGHCNGLLLLRDEDYYEGNCYCVCNPATVRCARLPSPPSVRLASMGGVFLTFDPAVSRHHEVFLFPKTMTQLRPRMEEEAQPPMKNLGLSRSFEEDQPADDGEEEMQVEVEHPEPAAEEPKDEVLSLLVFSSRTNEWECRDFMPGHCNPEHLYDIILDEYYGQIWKSATYWQGSLYVHCRKNILLVLRNSQGTYDMVQLPGIPLETEERTGSDALPTRSVLGSYEKGIHYVAFDSRFQLQVWALKEPADGQLAWTLTHEANFSPYVHRMNDDSSLPTQSMVPWKTVRKEAKLSLFEPLSETELRNLELYHEQGYGPGGRRTTTKVKKDTQCSWDSDEDNFIDMDESTAHQLEPPWYGHCRIVGLHPHKDVLLLRISGKALAYHLRTSRMQFLGKELVHDVQQCTQLHFSYGSKLTFPYRPCYVDALPTTKMSRRRPFAL